MRNKSRLQDTCALIISANDRFNAALLRGVEATNTPVPPTVRWKSLGLAAALFVAAGTPAFAQDVIGVQPVSAAVITVFQVIGIMAVGWGFLRLIGGRHTVEGLVTVAIGALGIAKTQAIATFLGL